MIESTATPVTYLFSDIEGSTRLWESDPARAARTLAWHDELSRTVVGRHRGTVVKMTGDGMHAAFDDPADAMAAASICRSALAETGVDRARTDQRALRPAPWRRPAARQRLLRARGEPRGTHHERRAWRTECCCRAAVAERVTGRLPPARMLRDLGLVRLRDLSSPERSSRLVHPSGCARSSRRCARWPARRTICRSRSSSFVGRDHEMEEVHNLLRKQPARHTACHGRHRKVAAVGAARRPIVLDDYADGVWLVELAPLVDGRELVPQAVATVLGVKEEAGSSLVVGCSGPPVRDGSCSCCSTTANTWSRRRGPGQGAAAGGPAVKMLATTATHCSIAGEAVYQLQPLPVPPAQDVAPRSTAQHASVQLFLDRATSVQPSFRLTDRLAGPVAEICRRLDGIPLALELAAARTRSLPVEAIAARLDHRFRLLIDRRPHRAAAAAHAAGVDRLEPRPAHRRRAGGVPAAVRVCRRLDRRGRRGRRRREPDCD